MTSPRDRDVAPPPGSAAIAAIALLIWRNDVLDDLEQEGVPLSDGVVTGRSSPRRTGSSRPTSDHACPARHTGGRAQRGASGRLDPRCPAAGRIVLEKLSRDFAGSLKVVKVNVDESPATAQRFQAMSIPMLVFLRNGQTVEPVVGAQPESVFRSAIERLTAA